MNFLRKTANGSRADDIEIDLDMEMIGLADGVAAQADQETTISQTADLFGVSMRTLRFYEEKQLLLPRRAGNRRFYGPSSHDRLRLILKGKAMGLGLDDIRKLVDLVEASQSHASERQDKAGLRALFSDQLQHLEQRRAELDVFIARTEEALSQV